MKNKTIGEQIAWWRQKRKLTQDQLAKKVGVTSKTTISGYEKGVRNPSIDTLRKIAEVLDCEISILLKNKKVTY